ncbi:MAG: hypothetical protein O8C67_08555 [Candidatus Methanoperedens sp.]|nr:hypothetical protein [Candidatus Methanoperedens sp.]
MNIRYYIDPETGLPHIYRHDVSEDEVKDVLLSLAKTVQAEKVQGLLWVKPVQDAI